ncbi:hypothetical protein ACJX0J_018892 [Zea mays]
MAVGRFIQDNFMLLDITKAFDSVSWPFLIESNVYPIQIFSLVASQPFRAVNWAVLAFLIWFLDYLIPFRKKSLTEGRWIADITGSLSTADRLAKRGLDHPEKCPLCDQDSLSGKGGTTELLKQNEMITIVCFGVTITSVIIAQALYPENVLHR